MRTRLRRTPKNPRGSAIMLFGLMLPVSVGFVALSVDTAVLTVARAQLTTEADAAALAGAMQLADYRLKGITDLSNQITDVNTKAATIGQANLVLGQTPVITQNPSNASGVGDILVGYHDPTDTTYHNPTDTPSIVDSSASASTFNSVQVTANTTSMWKSSDHEGLVPTFFAKYWGFNGKAVSVQSTATAVCYSIKGFQGDGNSNVHMLPIVLDQTTYNAMMAGTTTDQYTWDPATKTVIPGSDGITESKLYPVKSGSPGNWGTIKVGVSDNSTSTLGAQIQYGITPAQMATFPNSTIQLDSSKTPPSIDFDGNPGISAGLKDNIDAIIGQPVTIPIYNDKDPDWISNGGNGNNAWYRVVEFATVRILASDFSGNPKYVIVQPASLNDSSAIPGITYKSWTSGGLIRVHISR